MALTILIPLVEVCTLNTVVLGLIARFALLRTIFLANVILLEDVLHAVRGFGANAIVEDIAGDTVGSAVVREDAAGALVRASIVGDHLIGGFNHEVELALIQVDLMN